MYKLVSKIIVLSVLIIFLSLSGCLSTFYSPRIVEPNTTIMGGGVSGDYVYTYGNINYGFPAFGLFTRRGYENGFDAGLSINTNYLPIGIEGSVRKQFDVPFYIIDGIVFELGGNLGVVHYGLAYSASFLYKDFGITISRQNLKGVTAGINGFGPFSYNYQIIENSLKVSYVFKGSDSEYPVFFRVYTVKYPESITSVYYPMIIYSNELNFDRIGFSIGVGICFNI